jgi:lipoyl-dependent peroxiredoxin
MLVRRGSAEWKGNLKEGGGTLSAESGAAKGPYSFSSRFESGTGTNPEELVAAAHAGCFSMALSNQLATAGFTPTSVRTEAAVNMELVDGGFQVTSIDLRTEADVPAIEEEAFQDVAEKARTGCPMSKLLSAVEIRLDARLIR